MSASDEPVGPLAFDSLFAALASATGIVAAVSGGPDSITLMRGLAAWRTQGARPPVVVATVDHGLRPESREEAEAVAAWARACALPHRILTWTGPRPRTRIQETLREARYGLLAALARDVDATHVATAHTLDDQAETVLMRLARGSGIAGLSGMRAQTARDGIVVARPFLCVRKARLVATCEAEGWPYLVDPSNADPRFARARLRREVMPVLAREGLTPERLAALTVRARRAEDALEACASHILAAVRLPADDGRLAIDGAGLKAQPDAILLRVFVRAMSAALGVRDDGKRPIRLERFERRILGDVRRALDRGEALRMTLGGVLIEVRAAGPPPPPPEPASRRGRR